MRSRDASFAAALALVVTTALLGLETHAHHAQTDRLLEALDAYDRAQADLQRDVVSLRAGLLPSAAPLLTGTGRLLASADRLRLEAAGTSVQAEAAQLGAAAARQAELSAQLKADSDRLQASLRRFSRMSGRSGRPPRPEATALAAAMLRLTFNTGDTNQAEVARRLQALERHAPTHSEQALLAHGRILQQLLPRADGNLRQLIAADPAETRRALRQRLTTERARAELVAQQWRMGLSGVALALVLLLAALGGRLKAHVRKLRRRAQLEHLLAEVSAALIQATPEQVGAAVRAALRRLARAMGAERAYICGSGAEDLDQAWSGQGAGVPPDWPQRLRELVCADLPDRGARVLTARDPGSPALRTVLRENSIQALALAWIGTVEGETLVLGLDAAGPLTVEAEELDALRLALDALGGALRRARLERERSDLERRLDAAGRMEAMGAFASGIAHNFNNILAAIGGYAEMAGDMVGEGSAVSKPLAEIYGAVCRAQRLVDRILAFGRRRAVPNARVDLCALTLESAGLLRAAHEGAKVLVEPEPPGRELSDPLLVVGDASELQQVLLNLGSNAIQASSGRGPVRITLTAVRRRIRRAIGGVELPAGSYVLLSVADHGAGIEPRFRGRIFEPFFTTRDDGHGLGLATVAQIVREHGGAITVISAPRRGALFNVYLPLADRPQRTEGPPPTEPRLLILASGVDDLRVIEDLAAMTGYAPAGFADAEAAVAALVAPAPRFDALLVCHPEPWVGLAWARRLRQVASATPLTLSTVPAGDLEAQAARLGGCTLVSWPPSLTTLAAMTPRGRRRAADGVSS